MPVCQSHTDGACLQTRAVVVVNDELFIRSKVSGEIKRAWSTRETERTSFVGDRPLLTMKSLHEY